MQKQWPRAAHCGAKAANTTMLTALTPRRADELAASSCLASQGGSRRPVTPLTSFASSEFPVSASVGCGCGRLRRLLPPHHLLHSLPGRLRLVRPYHPRVSVRINDLAAPVAPKHIRDRALARGSEAEGLGNYFVDIFHVHK